MGALWDEWLLPRSQACAPTSASRIRPLPCPRPRYHPLSRAPARPPAHSLHSISPTRARSHPPTRAIILPPSRACPRSQTHHCPPSRSNRPLRPSPGYSLRTEVRRCGTLNHLIELILQFLIFFPSQRDVNPRLRWIQAWLLHSLIFCKVRT